MKRKNGRKAAALLLILVVIAAVLFSCPVFARSKKKKNKQTQQNRTESSSEDNSIGTSLGSLLGGLLFGDEDSESEPSGAESGNGTAEASSENGVSAGDELTVEEDGTYTSKDEVALYIHLYGHLPDNFIRKRDAQDLGWSGGSLEPYAPGMSIGGGKFGNYEGLLPYENGRTYYECDIDYDGGKRNAKRIVYSNDGLIYYTDDHYQSFEQLY